MRLHNRQPVVRIRHDVRHLYAYGVCEGILACLAYIALPAIGWTSDFSNVHFVTPPSKF